jgi:hypothetical protein
VGLFRRVGRALTRPMQPSTMAVTALIAALAVVIWVQRDKLPFANGPADGAFPTQSHPAGVFATTSPGAAPPNATKDNPFVGTAAETFPAGEAGITMPAATPVDGFGAEQVDAALKQVRAALVAGRLDRRSLVDHDSNQILAQLTADQRDDMASWFRDGKQLSITT